MGFSVTAFLFGFAVALHCGSRVLADRADCEKAKRNLPPPANNQALLCKAHPANNKPNKPVLVASWTQISKIEQIQETYLARYKQHKYEPVDSAENKNKYSGLDLFYTAKLKDIKYRIFFQRSALVYLFLDTEVDTLTDALRRRAPSLAGWKREGWAMLATNNRNIKYGVYEKAEQQLDKFVYVLSKRTNKKFFVDVPEIKKVARSNIPLSETANLWIAEGDGSPSPVIKFNGSDITNKKCPGALHNMWKVREGGKEYLTWHPMWDPCWWW